MRVKIIAALIVVALFLSGCDYVDLGQLWAYFDYCGYRTTNDTASGNCRTWWDIGNGTITEQQFYDAAYATVTAQAMPVSTSTPTSIPKPVYKPVNKSLELTPTQVPFISPVYPTATPTPFGGIYIPNISDYENLLDWYFK